MKDFLTYKETMNALDIQKKTTIGWLWGKNLLNALPHPEDEFPLVFKVEEVNKVLSNAEIMKIIQQMENADDTAELIAPNTPFLDKILVAFMIFVSIAVVAIFLIVLFKK